MGQLLTFPSLAKGAKVDLTVTFLDDLETGDSINGATVSAAVFSGTDATPGNLISGVANYATQPLVTQKIDASLGGVLGVIYTIIFTVTTTNGQVYSKEGRLAVITPGGKFGS